MRSIGDSKIVRTAVTNQFNENNKSKSKTIRQIVDFFVIIHQVEVWLMVRNNINKLYSIKILVFIIKKGDKYYRQVSWI